MEPRRCGTTSRDRQALSLPKNEKFYTPRDLDRVVQKALTLVENCPHVPPGGSRLDPQGHTYLWVGSSCLGSDFLRAFGMVLRPTLFETIPPSADRPSLPETGDGRSGPYPPTLWAARLPYHTPQKVGTLGDVGWVRKEETQQDAPVARSPVTDGRAARSIVLNKIRPTKSGQWTASNDH